MTNRIRIGTIPYTYKSESLKRDFKRRSFSIILITALTSMMAVGCNKPKPERQKPQDLLREITKVDSNSPAGEDKTIAAQAEKLLSDKSTIEPKESGKVSNPDPSKTDNAVLVIDSVPEKPQLLLPVEDDNSSPWMFDSYRPQLSWEVIYRGNTPVGHTSKKSVPNTRGNETLITTDFRSVLRFAMEGKEVRQQLTINSVERTNGELVSLTIVAQTGSESRMFVARIDGVSADIELMVNNKRQPDKIAWDNTMRGPFAIEQSLMRKPLKDNELRLLRFLDPLSCRIVESRLDAKSKYKSPVMLGKSKLLREIKVETRDGNVLGESTLWSDEDGVILKSFIQASDLRIFRVDEETYQEIESSFDLSFSANRSVPLLFTQSNLDAYRTALENENQLTYRFQLRQSDPYARVSNRAYQRKKSLDAFTSEITVFRLTDREQLPGGVEPLDKPTMSDSDLPSLIDLSNPILERVSTELLSQADNENVHLNVQTIANKLSHKYVSVPFNNDIRKLPIALSTNKLNSVEHSMALIALLRKVKIPARMAIGFAYDQSVSEPSMSFHAWVEYYHADWWWPIDPSQPAKSGLLDRIKIKEISSIMADIRREITQVLEMGTELTLVVQD